MSDVDEIEGYDPTTPFKPPSKKRKVPNNNGAVAGPSKPASNATKRKNVQPSPDTLPGTEGEDHGESSAELSPEAEEVIVKAIGPPSKARSKKPPSTAAVNGKVPAKAKAKAKTDPPPKAATKAAPVAKADVVDISGDEDVEMERGSSQLPPAPPANNRKGKAVPAPSRAKEDAPSSRELERLRKQLRDVTAQRDALTTQVKEWAALRQSEAEVSLQLERAQFEATIHAKDQLIQELTAQIARIEPMIASGRTSTLHFLTQEAADEAKLAVEREVERLRSIIKEKDGVISQKNIELRELEQAVADKDMELKLEINRCKDLQSRLSRDPPPASNRSRAAPDAAHNDPKNGSVMSLYEDMTNLLITNLKFEKSDFPEFDNEIFSCVFTHNETKASLSFTLHRIWSLREPDQPPARVKSKDQLATTMKYIPLNLHLESAEFREKIEFLSDVFTFSGEQMDVFFNSMRDYLGTIDRNNEPIVVDDD